MDVVLDKIVLGAASVIPWLADLKKEREAKTRVTAGSEYASDYISMAANRYAPTKLDKYYKKKVEDWKYGG